MRLRGHNTELHSDTSMPLTPRRQRHEGPRDGDGTRAIHRAAGGYFDLNVTYVATLIDPIDGKEGTNLAAHYPYPHLNGHRYWRGPDGRGKRVRVPVRRRHWSYDRWGQLGLTLERANGERTLTLNGALKLCVEAGAVPIKETKSRAFAKSDRPWKLLARDCERWDVPTWCKALVTMWGFKSKVIRAARNRVPLAAIYGKGLPGRARRLLRTRQLESGWKDGTKVYATW
jgi:hypothetical protein